MLSEETLIDRLDVDLEYGSVGIRTATRILRDDELISTSYHRRVIGSKDSLKGEDARVVAIAKAARAGAEG